MKVLKSTPQYFFIGALLASFMGFMLFQSLRYELVTLGPESALLLDSFSGELSYIEVRKGGGQAKDVTIYLFDKTTDFRGRYDLD